MAIGSTVPGFILSGDTIINETGTGNVNDAANIVRVFNRPFWMTDLIGKSKEQIINITQADHNFPYQWLIDRINETGRTGQVIVVNIHGDLVSLPGSPCLYFPAYMGDTVSITINIYAQVFGRGGDGAGTQMGQGYAPNGGNGNHAIQTEIGSKLIINNMGVIAGGGGGGACAWKANTSGSPVTCNGGGGGGRPYGAGGRTDGGDRPGNNTPGNPGTFDAPGTAVPYYGGPPSWLAGNGGDVGQSGTGVQHLDGNTMHGSSPGVTGYAVLGAGTQWINYGATYGPVQ